eukprot:3932733-Rhodomonas_salina.2
MAEMHARRAESASTCSASPASWCLPPPNRSVPARSLAPRSPPLRTVVAPSYSPHPSAQHLPPSPDPNSPLRYALSSLSDAHLSPTLSIV